MESERLSLRENIHAFSDHPRAVLAVPGPILLLMWLLLTACKPAADLTSADTRPQTETTAPQHAPKPSKTKQPSAAATVYPRLPDAPRVDDRPKPETVEPSKPGPPLIFDVRTLGWGSDGFHGFHIEIVQEVRAAPGEGIGHQSFGPDTPPFTLLETVDKDHVKVRIASDLIREGEPRGSNEPKEVLLAVGGSLRVHTQTFDAGATYTLRISDLRSVPPVVEDSPQVIAILGEYAGVIKDNRGSVQIVGPPGVGSFGEEFDKNKLERWKHLDATFWQNLSKLNNLRCLSLALTNVTDGDLKAIDRLPRLMSLDLPETKVTDAGMVHLEGLKRLEGLDLARTNITDAGIAHLVGLQRLENLNLTETSVSDDCVRSLRALPHLAKLHPYGTKITREGLWELRSAVGDFRDPATSWEPWGTLREPHFATNAEQLAKEPDNSRRDIFRLLVLGCEISVDENDANYGARIPVPREDARHGIYHTLDQTKRTIKLLAQLSTVNSLTFYTPPYSAPQSPPLDAEAMAMLADLHVLKELKLGGSR